MGDDTLLTRLLGIGDASRRAGAVHFLSDRDPTIVRASLDREGIAAAALACAAVLVDAGVGAGERVVVAAASNEAVVGWLLGAMWIGAVPVPVPSPTRVTGGAGVDRFATVIRHCAPRAVIGDERALTLARSMGTGAALIAAAGSVARGARRIGMQAARPSAEPAFVQYTAGSTGEPKGVVVTLANLRANLEAIEIAVGVRPEDRVVSWLPLFHDMGLVGTLLFSLYWDVPLYLFSPMGFMLRPVGWLEAISAHRGTLSPAPHFAYSLCAFKLHDDALRGIDLSSWRLALDGAEPIRAQNARAFIERFRRYGFRSEAYHAVYGLSEATLAVTFPTLGEGLRAERLSRNALARGVAELATSGVDDERGVVEAVSVGRPLEGMRVEICSPDGAPLPERAVGEICVSGPSVSPRYLGQGGPDRSVLRTGDIGYVADGALYVVSRLKDLIIQGGTNLHPSDIEAVAADVPRVCRGRVVAFGVTREQEGTEEVVVAAEVTGRGDEAALASAIRGAVQRRSGIVVGDVILLDRGTLPLTTSGKLIRNRVREAYVAGTLEKHGLGRWMARIRRRAVKELIKRSP